MDKQFKQNLVVEINVASGKIVLFLNYGTSYKSAKIEEYDFEYNGNVKLLFALLQKILEDFSQENACKQCSTYIVFDDADIALDYLQVPNVNAIKNKAFLKTEFSRLYNVQQSKVVKVQQVQKNKKNVLYRCEIFNKEMVHGVNDVCKKVGLNVKAFCSSTYAFIRGFNTLGKVRSVSYVCAREKKDSVQVVYAHKGLAICYYDLRKGAISNVQSFVEEGAYEVYFSTQSIKHGFMGVQLDINGEPMQKNEILQSSKAEWEAMNNHFFEKLDKQSGFDVVKVGLILCQNAQGLGYAFADQIFIEQDNEDKDALEKVVKDKCGLDIIVKTVQEQLPTNCLIKNYLHLYGAIGVDRDKLDMFSVDVKKS